MNILIVEDNEFQRKSLIKIIREVDINLSIYEADNKDDALKIASRCSIDIFYLDISLVNSSGLDLALELRKMNKYKLSWIIFVTTSKQYILSAFKKIHCYDYILKPYSKEKIKAVTIPLISHCIKDSHYKEERRNYVVFNLGKISLKIYLDDIIFIEVRLRNLTVHTRHDIYEVERMPLKRVLDLVENEYIVQAHKSYIINTKYIKGIERESSTSWKVYFYDYKGCAFIGAKYKCNIDRILIGDKGIDAYE